MGEERTTRIGRNGQEEEIESNQMREIVSLQSASEMTRCEGQNRGMFRR